MHLAVVTCGLRDRGCVRGVGGKPGPIKGHTGVSHQGSIPGFHGQSRAPIQVQRSQCLRGGHRGVRVCSEFSSQEKDQEEECGQTKEVQQRMQTPHRELPLVEFFLQLEMLKEEVVIVKTKGNEAEAFPPCYTCSLICVDREAVVESMLLQVLLQLTTQGYVQLI